MPRIPAYEINQTRTEALPGVRQQIATPDGAFGIRQGQQIQQVGQSLGRISDAMQQEMERADASRANDALNKLRERELELTFDREKGYTNLKGAAALNRESGKPLTEEYAEQLDRTRQELEASLGTPRQREAFRQRANERITSFRGQLMNYEGTEFERYQSSVNEGTIASASQEVLSYYNDPDRVKRAVTDIRSAVYENGRMQGRAAEQIKSDSDKVVSGAHIGAVAQALASGDPLQAERYMAAFKDDFLPADLLKAHALVNKEVANVIGSGAAQQAILNYVQVTQPDDFKVLWGALTTQESGQRQFGADGKPLTSRAGAVGIAQVMPGTAPEAAKLAGLPWDENRYKNDASYNEQLGQAYFNQQLKNFGDVAKALAAYNAGPGATRKAVAAAEKEGNPDGWLPKLPAETQAYVPKILDNFTKKRGVRQEAGAPTLEDLQQQIRANPQLQARPQAMEVALAKLSKEWDTQQKGIRATQDAAFSQAMQLIEGGASYTDLPDEVKSSLNPTRWDDLRRYEKLVTEGSVATDWELYANLYDSAIQDPDRFVAQPIEQLTAQFDKLAPAERQRLIALRKELSKPETRAQSVTAAQQIAPYIQQLPANRRGMLRQAYNDELIARSSRGPLSAEDRQKIIDNLMMRDTKGTFLGVSVGMTKPLFQYPREEREAARQALVRAGVRSPSGDLIIKTIEGAKRGQ